MGLKLMEQMELVAGRFGDEESTLLDRYERLSFEVQLNQAILGRSLSQPATLGRRITTAAAATFTSGSNSSILSSSSSSALPRRPHLDDDDVNRKKQGSGHPKSSRFQRVLNKLFRPKTGASASAKKRVEEDCNLGKWKPFSRRRSLQA